MICRNKIAIAFLIFFAVLLNADVLYAQNNCSTFCVNGESFDSLQKAFDAVSDGDTVYIANGHHKQSAILKKNNVNIIGLAGSAIHDTASAGKGALVLQGNNTHD